MRIGRVDHEGSPRAAVIDGDTVRVLGNGVEVVDMLSVDSSERERIAGRAEAEVSLAQATLLAPVEPPTIRDFSVFEQHISGVIKDANSDATVPSVWYESPFCYFTNPNALTGPGEDIPVPPGCERLDLELEVAAVIGRSGRNLTPGEAGAYIAGYTIFNDWSARDLQMAEMRLGLREHARAVDRDTRRARGVPRRRPPRPRAARRGQRERARDRHAGEYGLELSRAGVLRLEGDVGPARGRARIGDVRQRLPARVVGPARA
jgi:hypothetical protein